MAESGPKRLVTTRIAALYLLVMERPQERVQAYREADVRRSAVRVYNAARDGKITRYGDDSWGGARWCLAEVHSLLQLPQK